MCGCGVCGVGWLCGCVCDCVDVYYKCVPFYPTHGHIGLSLLHINLIMQR